MLPMPFPISVELMHHTLINIPNLFLKHWTGKIKPAPTDHVHNWPWVVLKGVVWREHGARIAKATQYFPGNFHWTPRGPAKKWNSGYTANEKNLYFFGLRPGHF